jgi:membrane associated rhomboid family serine protease
MGFADREYNRADFGGYGQPTGGRVGGLRMLSVNTWLIIVCVVVFILDQLITAPLVIDGHPIVNVFGEPTRYHVLEKWGYFSVNLAIAHLQVWRFVTFQFFHANFSHILFNMIGLFFFGPLIEQYLGSKRYLVFYLLCGISGAVTYVLLWMLHILIGNPGVPLVGASAGIFGVLIAASQIAPNSTVLIYGIIPMRLRVFALVLLAVAAYTVIFQGNNAGGEAAHLGGAALGFLLIKQPGLLDLLVLKRRRRSLSP